VREVQGVHDGLAYVGIGVAGERAEPRLHGVQGLADGGEATAVDDALDSERLVVGQRWVAVGDDDGCRQIAEGIVRAQFLQSFLRIDGLVVGIGIDECALAIEHHFTQDGGHGLALGPPQPGQRLRRLRLVLGDPACHPAVGEAQVVEGVEQPRRGGVGETEFDCG
jgi:hypothetical protein